MSFESFMPLVHSLGMREVIGKTRSGKEIWIDFDQNIYGQYHLQVVEFELETDQYDTLCVMEAYGSRIRVKNEALQLERWDFFLDELDAWFETQSVLYSGLEALANGHIVSTDRVRHGQSLIHPAYRN